MVGSNSCCRFCSYHNMDKFMLRVIFVVKTQKTLLFTKNPELFLRKIFI